MKKIRHKASLTLRSSLHKASEPDWAKLVSHVIEAILAREISVEIEFSYILEFPESFPKGIVLRKTPTTDVRRLRTQKLMKWLHEKGYSMFSYAEIMAGSRNFACLVGEIEAMTVGE